MPGTAFRDGIGITLEIFSRITRVALSDRRNIGRIAKNGLCASEPQSGDGESKTLCPPHMDLRSHRTQLVLTALTASAATAGLVSAYNIWDRQRRRDGLSHDVQRAVENAVPADNRSPPARVDDVAVPYDEELIREQLARNYAFFGDESMQRIRGGRVVIVGCGGVGSFVAMMLARSWVPVCALPSGMSDVCCRGIAKLRLVDFDYVTLSSLNRHASATLADVGTAKVKSLERAIRSFSRWIEVDARVDIWRKEEGGILLEDMDWVVGLSAPASMRRTHVNLAPTDCIDNIDTKVDLLAYCHNNGIRVFSSMGASAKQDPTRTQIADIAHTHYDPLARAVRRRLRAHGITGGIPVVYSTEVPGDIALLPLPEDEFAKGKVKELGAFDDFRVRILPVIGPLPAIFGLFAATYVLCELAGRPIPNPLPVKNRRKLYERLLRDLIVREGRLAGDPEAAG
jgi:tRNA A37 threonylcarbamoyladenosine dehydratase